MTTIGREDPSITVPSGPENPVSRGEISAKKQG